MKTKKILLLIFGIFLFTFFVFYNLKYILKSRATNPELYIKIKLQGDYSQNTNPSIKTKIVLYTIDSKVTELTSQPIVQESQNIFSIKMTINGFDLTKFYAIFIKPNKYLGRLFCSTIITGSSCTVPRFVFKNAQNDINLTNFVFFAGDISPFDGKVSSYDVSAIIGALGKTSVESAITDINYNGITNTQDYWLALYSLGQNAADDPIKFASLLATPTPTKVNPTSTPKPTKKPTPTIKPKKTPTPAPTKTPTIVPSISQTPTTTPTAGSCNQMDNGLPNSTMHYPNGTSATPKTTKQIWDFNHGRNYSMPYRNPNCSLTQAAIDKAYDRMKTFYPSYWPQTKLKQDWQTVQTYAKKYNFNPLFVITLWIEESAAGGATASQKLGCIYRLNKNDTFTFLPASSTICEQMECVFGRRSVVPDNFGLWACQYQLGASQWDGSKCLGEPTFTKNLQFWYDYLSDGQPDECKLKYCPNAPGCQ